MSEEVSRGANSPLTGCNLWLGLGENVLALDFGKAEDNLEFWRTVAPPIPVERTARLITDLSIVEPETLFTGNVSSLRDKSSMTFVTSVTPGGKEGSSSSVSESGVSNSERSELVSRRTCVFC